MANGIFRWGGFTFPNPNSEIMVNVSMWYNKQFPNVSLWYNDCCAILFYSHGYHFERINATTLQEGTNVCNVMYQNDAIGLTEGVFVQGELSATHHTPKKTPHFTSIRFKGSYLRFKTLYPLKCPFYPP
jgi:hypothetical protein